MKVYHKAAERLDAGELTVSVDEMTGVQAKGKIAPDKGPRGNFTGVKKKNKSTEELEQRIMDFIDYFNDTMAKLFKWMFQGFDSSLRELLC